MSIDEQGIGIIYFPGFEETIERNSSLISTIEIEPQTMWRHNMAGLGSYSCDPDKLVYLKSLKKTITFHGVGFPIGGSIPSDTVHIECMQNMINSLRPAWMSEHLSFNNIIVNEKKINTNFLLPPLQTMEGALNAAEKIKQYSANFDLPFAFETGTNYLRPQPFELSDGQFIQEVAKNADCHILLDIHNLLVNQKNGRQNIFDLLLEIDLERILQIHLAGGFYFKGYYLDAHSGISSAEVLDVFEKVVRMLPRLKGITFEMLATSLPQVSKTEMREQLESMNRIWDLRGKNSFGKGTSRTKIKSDKSIDVQVAPSLTEYERELAFLAIKKQKRTEILSLDFLNYDKGVEVIQTLVEKFRKSQLVISIKLSVRYILLKYSEKKFEEIFLDYSKNNYPCLFASDTGILFSEYLLKKSKLVKTDSFFKDLVTYEYNSLLTLLDGMERKIEISFNPYDVIPSLQSLKLPKDFPKGHYVVNIVQENEEKGEKVDMVFHS